MNFRVKLTILKYHFGILKNQGHAKFTDSLGKVGIFTKFLAPSQENFFIVHTFLSSTLKLYFCKLCPFLDKFISFWLHKLRSFIISSNQLCVCVHFCFLLINFVITRHIPKFSSVLSECFSKVLVGQDFSTLHYWHFEPGNYLLLG